MPGIEKMKLFKLLKEHLGINPYERYRFGGLSGFFQYTKVILKALHVSNSTPKKSQAVILMPDKDKISFHLFYMNKKECDAKHVRYSMPVLGGHFQIDFTKFDMRTQYGFFKDFLSAQPLGAAWMINLREFLKEEDAPHLISPEAVNNELQYGCMCKNHIDEFYPLETVKASERWFQCYKYFADQFGTITLVCHPCGMHLDKFPKDKALLENRMCFSKKADLFEYGRGGNGLKNFTFAVLDW